MINDTASAFTSGQRCHDVPNGTALYDGHTKYEAK